MSTVHRSELLFRNRADAGRQLADLLEKHRGGDGVVLGLARGGVPVAHEVARELGLPLDVFTVRKLGVPQQPELAMGAIATGGVRVLNPEVIDAAGVSDSALEAATEKQREELGRRERAYRGTREPAEVAGKTAILVDDGLATGASMRAAVMALRQRDPAAIIVAVPVGAGEIVRDLESKVDEVVCARIPEDLGAVGAWYEVFDQTTDEEVQRLLGVSPNPPR